MVSLGGKSRGINTRIVLFLIPLKVGSILGGPDLPQTRTGIKFRILTNVKFIIIYQEGRGGGRGRDNLPSPGSNPYPD